MVGPVSGTGHQGSSSAPPGTGQPGSTRARLISAQRPGNHQPHEMIYRQSHQVGDRKHSGPSLPGTAATALDPRPIAPVQGPRKKVSDINGGHDTSAGVRSLTRVSTPGTAAFLGGQVAAFGDPCGYFGGLAYDSAPAIRNRRPCFAGYGLAAVDRFPSDREQGHGVG